MDYKQERHVVIPQGELMDEAKASLSGRWGTGAVAVLVILLISGVAGIIPFGSLIVGGPFALGMAMFFLKISREEEEVEIGNIFDGFKVFGKAAGAYILMMFAITLGMLLLIVPGIMLALGLSQTYFILVDDPEIGVVDALKDSWKLMDGHKFDLFILGLRFIGWAILCIFTLGIGFFFLFPYIQVTYAKFYNSIRYGDHRSGPLNDDIIHHLVD